ncbi:MAG: sulfotransferase family protein [Bacteroidia bacterium]|nr:sulfotransferase family protein [Bacteroidia bacterium]NNC86312.1 sulfotransferase family 2 domain-containing protein [Bacteroidia bacterium]
MKQRILFKFLSFLPTKAYLYARWWLYKTIKRSYYNDLQVGRTKVVTNDYSFLPFDQKKAIFIHLPKCAGIAVSKALFGNYAGGHTRLEMHLSIFHPQEILSYFKFTIVRNPWDRLVSAYHFLEKGGFEENDKIWFEENLRQYRDFDDFVRNWLNRDTIWSWHHFRPQFSYILDDNMKVPLDFIGYIENINDDFDIVCNKLGVSNTLEKLNKSSHKDYREYYTDETRKLVEGVYAEDIKLLGYSFDNSNLPNQIKERKLHFDKAPNLEFKHDSY